LYTKADKTNNIILNKDAQKRMKVTIETKGSVRKGYSKLKFLNKSSKKAPK
jgi:hypothetical protein